jgi:hypothetical protein
MAILLARRPAIAALVTVVVIFLVTLGACNETRRSLGEECLKGDDCVSGLCSSQHCAEPAPVLEASVPADAALNDVSITDGAPSVDANDAASSSDGDGLDAADAALDGD